MKNHSLYQVYIRLKLPKYLLPGNNTIKLDLSISLKSDEKSYKPFFSNSEINIIQCIKILITFRMYSLDISFTLVYDIEQNMKFIKFFCWCCTLVKILLNILNRFY